MGRQRFHGNDRLSDIPAASVRLWDDRRRIESQRHQLHQMVPLGHFEHDDLLEERLCDAVQHHRHTGLFRADHKNRRFVFAQRGRDDHGQPEHVFDENALHSPGPDRDQQAQVRHESRQDGGEHQDRAAQRLAVGNHRDHPDHQRRGHLPDRLLGSLRSERREQERDRQDHHHDRQRGCGEHFLHRQPGQSQHPDERPVVLHLQHDGRPLLDPRHPGQRGAPHRHLDDV